MNPWQQELQEALEAQDEQRVGRILTSLFINTQKSSDTEQASLHTEVQNVFSNLSSSTASYWQKIASGYTS